MKCAGRNFSYAAGIAALAAFLALGWAGGASATVFMKVAKINSFQEVPPNPSTANGFATITVDDVANTVAYHVEFTVGTLTSPETAAHIHCCAPPGMNAGVIVPLPLGNPKDGMATISAANIAAILAGSAYVNIHTSMFSGGEIRGQIIDPTGVAAPDLTSSWGTIKSLFR